MQLSVGQKVSSLALTAGLVIVGLVVSVRHECGLIVASNAEVVTISAALAKPPGG
ncbi:MAG: hypothetical protein QM760_09150 [Nibricoccus sp.]